MKTDMSIINLIQQASVLVQIIMLILLGFSIGSWVTIIQKWLQLRDVRIKNNLFEKTFWSGIDLNALYQTVQQDRGFKNNISNPLSRIFEAGMQAYLKSRHSKPGDSSAWLDIAKRAMQAGNGREIAVLDKGLAFLASVANVSPYIGLLGTVWGIMNSFRGLVHTQQSSLASVAPGIAEALVATAIGLFAAIPATIAYNRYAAEVDAMAGNFDTFIDEFLNILQRQSH